MGERRAFRWRPSTRGGALGPWVDAEGDAADLDYAASVYRAALLFSPGSVERTRRLTEVRTLMDALALVDARVVASPVAAEPEARTAADVAARLTEEAAATVEEDEPEPEDDQLDLLAPQPVFTGKFSGYGATDTERASGEAKELEDAGPLRRGLAGHRVLSVYRGGERLTAYAASKRAAEGADFHGLRRESRRLFDRGYLRKDGTLPNPAPRGRPHVDAYRITNSGLLELERLG